LIVIRRFLRSSISPRSVLNSLPDEWFDFTVFECEHRNAVGVMGSVWLPADALLNDGDPLTVRASLRIISQTDIAGRQYLEYCLLATEIIKLPKH
jgi:hypothetical protein